jgi:hypothetical protein
VHIENDLPLPMILSGEPIANTNKIFLESEITNPKPFSFIILESKFICLLFICKLKLKKTISRVAVFNVGSA